MNERNYLFFEYLFLWTGILYLLMGMFILIFLGYERTILNNFLFIFFFICIMFFLYFRSKRIKWVKEMKDEIEKLKREIWEK